MGGRFDGKVVVVTGSGQSIGRSIAHLFAREGASVVVNSRSEKSRDDTPTAGNTLREITEAGGKAAVVFADVGTMSGARAVIVMYPSMSDVVSEGVSSPKWCSPASWKTVCPCSFV